MAMITAHNSVAVSQGILQTAWEAISIPQKFVKRDSARSFEEYAFANFGSAKNKLLKTDSSKSDGLATDFDPIVGSRRTWLDVLLCRLPRPQTSSLQTKEALSINWQDYGFQMAPAASLLPESDSKRWSSCSPASIQLWVIALSIFLQVPAGSEDLSDCNW